MNKNEKSLLSDTRLFDLIEKNRSGNLNNYVPTVAELIYEINREIRDMEHKERLRHMGFLM